MHFKAIKDWLQNHSRTRKQHAGRKFGKKWTTCEVLIVTKKAEIEDALWEKGLQLGSRKMITKYQETVNDVINKLSEESLEEAKQMAEQWNKERPPPEVQAE